MIIRPYQIYGPYQDLNRFIPIIINNCLQNRKFPCSDGNQFRDFLYIDDFVKYLFILMNKTNTMVKYLMWVWKTYEDQVNY